MDLRNLLVSYKDQRIPLHQSNDLMSPLGPAGPDTLSAKIV